MLVSAARMLLPQVLPYSFVHLLDGAGSRRPVGKERLVHPVGGVAPDPAHHDLAVLFVPFEDGPRSEAQLATDLGGNRDLSLSRQPRPRQSHITYITMVMRGLPVQTHEVPPFRRAIILVADGVGCGHAADASAYGDSGADTIGNIARAVGELRLPNLEALGLGHLTAIAAFRRRRHRAAPGRPRRGLGRQGHDHRPLGDGGPRDRRSDADLSTRLSPRDHRRPACSGGRNLLGNKTASGTVIIDELGPRHLATGDLILYTSADSVIQIAAHEEIVPLAELYRICEAARLIADRHRIGRVIARPFVGAPGAFRRTYNRRDYSLVPPAPTLLDHLVDAGQRGDRRRQDLRHLRGPRPFALAPQRGERRRAAADAGGATDPRAGLLFVNLVDFDMLYGHRNDVAGFARALAELDAWLPAFENALAPGDVAFITADHGNNPTTPGTDHTRERVPLLAFGPGVRPVPLGIRSSFCDLGQTIAAALGIRPIGRGSSFLDAITG